MKGEMKMIKNLKIFETGNKFGNMNTAAKFYPEGYSANDRKAVHNIARRALGRDLDVDGRKMYMADQLHKRGTWKEIDKEYVEAYPNGWSDISEDIVVTKAPGVVIGHPVADCPVVMAYDTKQKVVAVGHCSAELIDKKMPMLVADALYNSYRSKDEDIYTYVSACAGNSWAYDKWPNWAKEEKFWEKYITEGKDGLFHIDLKNAVRNQLLDRNIAPNRIDVSPIDTITDDNFYSNSAAFNGQIQKNGRHFAGAFFKDELDFIEDYLDSLLDIADSVSNQTIEITKTTTHCPVLFSPDQKVLKKTK